MLVNSANDIIQTLLILSDLRIFIENNYLCTVKSESLPLYLSNLKIFYPCVSEDGLTKVKCNAPEIVLTVFWFYNMV